MYEHDVDRRECCAHSTFMRRATLLGLLAAPFVVLAATACEETHACTAAGCGPSRLTIATEGWVPGEYQIEVRYTLGGEQAFECTFAVADSEDPGQRGDDAGAEDGIQSTCEQVVGTGRAVRLYPVPGMEPVIEVYDAPDAVQLVLRNGDRELFDDTIALDHVASYPNGPDCGACRSATMTVTLQ